jgi:hypothetical protein
VGTGIEYMDLGMELLLEAEAELMSLGSDILREVQSE